MWIALLPWLTGTAQARCPASYRDVIARTEDVLDAWSEGRREDVLAANARLHKDLACVAGVLEPPEVQGVHFAAALEAVVLGDYDTAVAALQSVLALDPAFQPAKLLDGHVVELAGLYQHALTPWTPGEPRRLPLVDWSVWRVDGDDAAGTVPVGRPVLVQLLDYREGHLSTWYLDDGGLPPNFVEPDELPQEADRTDLGGPTDSDRTQPLTPRSTANAELAWSGERALRFVLSGGLPLRLGVEAHPRSWRFGASAGLYLDKVTALTLSAGWCARRVPVGVQLHAGPALWWDGLAGGPDGWLYLSYGVEGRAELGDNGRWLVTAGLGRVENRHQAWWVPQATVGLRL